VRGGASSPGPSGTTIRSSKPDATQDFSTDPRTAPWRDSAIRCGHRSVIGLPLKDKGGKVFGDLTIYSSEPDGCTSQEIRLLDELAGDLAFGIGTLRGRAERKR